MDLECIGALGLADWAAISQIFQSAFLVLAVVYAFFQSREAKRARELTAVQVLFDEIGTPEIRKLRSWALDSGSKTISVDNKDDVGKIRELAVAYDRVGLMIRHNLLPDDILFEFQEIEIEALWKMAKEIIPKIRKQYCNHFKFLAETWLPRMRKKNR